MMRGMVGMGVLSQSPSWGVQRANAAAVTLLLDTFTGSGDLSAHTPNTGSAWSYAGGGTFTLDGAGKVGCTDTGFALLAASSALPQSITITCDTTNGDSGAFGVVFNYVDVNNYYLLDPRDGVVYKVTAGTPAASITGSPGAVGVPESQRLILTTTTVAWFRNGVQQGSTIARAAPADTKVGLYADSAAASDGSTFWDNFKVTT